MFGVNVNPSFQRVYNNLCVQSPWLGDPVLGEYEPMRAPHVNAAGDLASLPAGITTGRISIQNPGPTVASWFRLTFDGTDSLDSFQRNNDVVPDAPTIVNSRTIEFYMDMTLSASPNDPNSGNYLAISGTPGTPISNVDCREITGPGGDYVDEGLYFAEFIDELKLVSDRPRIMDLQGINGPHMPSTGTLTWEQRAQSRRAFQYSSARLVHGTGSGRLMLTVKAYHTTDAEAELLAAYGPDDLYTGAGGNRLTLTILAASGGGSVVLDGLDITVTPAAGATSAAQIAAQIYAHADIPKMVEIVAGTNTAPVSSGDYNAALAAGAVATLAETNFTGGFDGPGGNTYWPDVVELGQQLGQPLNFLLPQNADDDYAAQVASLIVAAFPASYHLWLAGKGNEPFNYGTQATRWYYTLALMNGVSGIDPQHKLLKQYGTMAISNFTAMRAVAADFPTAIGAQSSSASTTTGVYKLLPNFASAVGWVEVAPYFYFVADPVSEDAFWASGYLSASQKPAELAEHIDLLDGTDVGVVLYEWGQHLDNETVLATAQSHHRDEKMGELTAYAASELYRLHGVGVTIPVHYFSDITPISTGRAGGWGMREYRGQAPTPKSIAWDDFRQGIFRPYFQPGLAPALTGTRVVGQVLTLTLPEAFNTDEATVQMTRDGVALGSPVTIDPSEDTFTYTQVEADIGTVLDGTVTLSNAHYSKEYAITDGAETEDEVPPFSLDDLTSLLARWDANTGMVGTTHVTSWAAAQGSGALTSAGNAPARSTVDGHPAAVFAKASYDSLPSNVGVGTGDFTYLVVGKVSGGDISGDQTMFGNANSNGPSVDVQSSGATLRLVRQGVAVQGSVTSGVDMTERFVVTARHRASDDHWSLRVNGVEVGSGTGSGDFSAGNLVLGFNPGNGAGFNGPLHCLGMCDSYLSEGLTAAWEAYEMALWDVA
ncbi:hypothetical protein M9978_02260 [Sphingomonas sp. MG17]|uniref:Concanavalin A-like lectin/glucanases superfamily protein n=1 Tax=Sphingomonas tagetis TaxID=2949092 RepID=A0A9X2HHF9_9SPHN|nr:hypothetical protein [Sphingomonas tagetis]MCP3729239.1 hypothetical protein [Sphingomonas tagetis]